MNAIEFFSLLVSLAVTGYLVWPFFSDEKQIAEIGKEAQILADSRQRCIQILKDLELEYSLGNMDADDYQTTRLRIEKELAAYLQEDSRG